MATASSVTTDLATCPICVDLFDNPKSLPCLHAFCLKCLQHHFKDKCLGDEVPCPMCRKEFQIPSDGLGGLQHHFMVQQLVDERKASNEKFDEVTCEVCFQDQLKLYCLDCNENICWTCSGVKLKNHSSIEIAEVADNFKLRIGDDDKQILSAISSVREQSEQTNHDEVEFIDKVEEIKKMVIATGDVVKRSVDDQVNDVLIKLQSVTSESVKKVESVQEAYQLAVVSMESFHTRSRELLDKDRPSDVTRAACELHNSATEFLGSDVNTVKYRPPHVTFTPADVTQVKGLNLIGKLTVTTEEQPEPGKSQSAALFYSQ